MSTVLGAGDSRMEASYRRLLRWYPAGWRDANEAALLGTLLDIAHSEGRDRPRRDEAVDLAVNGVGARVAAVLPAAARERVAGFAFATGLAWSLVYFVVEDWMPWSPAAHHATHAAFGPFNSPGVIVTALWVVAAVLLWSGRTAAARISLLGSATAAVVVLALGAPTAAPTVICPSPDLPTFVLLVGLALLAAGGHPRPGRFAAVTAAVWALILAAGLFAAHRLDHAAVPLAPWHWWWYDSFGRYIWQGSAQIAVLLVGVLVLAAVLALFGHRTASTIITTTVAPWTAAVLAGLAIEWDGALPTTVITLRIVVLAAAWLAAGLGVLFLGRTSRTSGMPHGTPDPA